MVTTEQTLNRDQRQSAPTLSGPGRVGSRLPLSLQPLIGRERDLNVLIDLLSLDSTRLVTLTGPGGVGKSRLAIHAARALEAHFDGDVHLIRLAPLYDPDLMLAAIATALDLPEPDDAPLLDHLQEPCWRSDRHYSCSIASNAWSAPDRYWPSSCASAPDQGPRDQPHPVEAARTNMFSGHAISNSSRDRHRRRHHSWHRRGRPADRTRAGSPAGRRLAPRKRACVCGDRAAARRAATRDRAGRSPAEHSRSRGTPGAPLDQTPTPDRRRPRPARSPADDA